MNDIVEELKKCKKLLDDGIITQEEFNTKKRTLLKLDVEPKENNIEKQKDCEKEQNNVTNIKQDNSLIFDIVCAIVFIIVISICSWG